MHMVLLGVIYVLGCGWCVGVLLSGGCLSICRIHFSYSGEVTIYVFKINLDAISYKYIFDMFFVT